MPETRTNVPLPPIQACREIFTPSPQFPRPHVILGLAVICATTDEEADYLASSADLVWVRLQRGELKAKPGPEEALAYPYTSQERATADGYRKLLCLGRPRRVRAEIEETGADEVMITSNLHGRAERMRS